VVAAGVVVLAPGRLVPPPSGRLVTALLFHSISVNQPGPGVEGILADGFLQGCFGRRLWGDAEPPGSRTSPEEIKGRLLADLLRVLNRRLEGGCAVSRK
jgi:hypothetical protein